MGEREGIVIDFELIKINDRKFHSFYTISNLEEFLECLIQSVQESGIKQIIVGKLFID